MRGERCSVCGAPLRARFASQAYVRKHANVKHNMLGSAYLESSVKGEGCGRRGSIGVGKELVVDYFYRVRSVAPPPYLQHTMGVPYSGGFRGKIGSVFHYFSLGGLPLWGSKTGSKHPKTGLI